MKESICRLCLKTVPDNNFQTIGETLKDVLNKLLLNVNLEISRDAAMCNECVRNLQSSSSFKSICVNANHRMDIKSIVNTNVDLMDVSKDQETCHKICYFCTKLTEEESSVLLNESKENMFILDMLQKHMPELNLSNTEELVTCKICLESLHSLLGCVTNCLHMEENIRNYIGAMGTDDNGQVELKAVQQFIFNSVLKCEAGCNDVKQIGEDCDKNETCVTIKAEIGIKSEELDELELDIKHEEIVNKSDKNACESSFLSESHGNYSQMKRFKCTMCPFSSKYNISLKKHILLHKNGNFRRRMVFHKDAFNVYHCVECSYHTSQKMYLQRHMITHKSLSEVTAYQCESCSFKTKYKKNIEKHMLTHANPSEITMYECSFCSFKTKYKHCCKTHMLKHRAPSELTVHHCDLCSYKTTVSKERLRRHMIVHKKSSEVVTYKCDFCSFITKYKNSHERHMLSHRDPSETPMYMCTKCSYASKDKKNLKKHTRIHKEAMYKCESCSFQTKHNDSLVKHKLLHKPPSEVPMYACDECFFETNSKRTLKRHTLVHKDPSEVKMYKCDSCPFQTKHKNNLKMHNIRLHNENMSEITMYNCEYCSYQTVRKSYLKHHHERMHKTLDT